MPHHTNGQAQRRDASQAASPAALVSPAAFQSHLRGYKRGHVRMSTKSSVTVRAPGQCSQPWNLNLQGPYGKQLVLACILNKHPG